MILVVDQHVAPIRPTRRSGAPVCPWALVMPYAVLGRQKYDTAHPHTGATQATTVRRLLDC